MKQAVLVTGCASGIGRATAKALLLRGFYVLATDRDEPALRRAAQEDDWPTSDLHLRALDVRDPEQWQQAVALAVTLWGRLDVLLHIAGVLKPGWVVQSGVETVDLHVDVNIKGAMLGLQAAAAQMVTQEPVAGVRGHVVQIASMAALAPIPGLAHYSASKYAVRAFSLAAAEELRPQGVAVSVVCPDAVATPMLDLQKSHPQAAMTFSGPRVLTVAEVVATLLDRVLPDRPLLVMLPWSRGMLARLGDLLPGLGRHVAPLLQRKGRAAQRRWLEP
jgi:NAD(P)-dependent dehydrogenase (short-subunit alcohol dehydrogenase family)